MGQMEICCVCTFVLLGAGCFLNLNSLFDEDFCSKMNKRTIFHLFITPIDLSFQLAVGQKTASQTHVGLVSGKGAIWM